MGYFPSSNSNRNPNPHPITNSISDAQKLPSPPYLLPHRPFLPLPPVPNFSPYGPPRQQQRPYFQMPDRYQPAIRPIPPPAGMFRPASPKPQIKVNMKRAREEGPFNENKPSTKMSRLLSTWSNNVETVPANHLMPPKLRPATSIEDCKEIPVIDLGLAGYNSRDYLVHLIMKASQEYGIFQVINHGVSEDIIKEAKGLYKDLFQMSSEDKGSDSYGSKCNLFTGSGIKREEFELLKNTLRHNCYPLEQHIPYWPVKPAQYREVVGTYAVEVRKLGMRILDLIGEGLGLEEEYFDGELTQSHDMAINYYPPCPDLALAMGVGAHKDTQLITLLQQDVAGLEILKDGKWISVEALPNAFVVIGGWQLEIISNGKSRSAEHRIVRNSMVARTSIMTHLGPSLSTVVEPAKDIVATGETPRFNAYLYGEFRNNYIDYLDKIYPDYGELRLC